jgi:hypothetical protein
MAEGVDDRRWRGRLTDGRSDVCGVWSVYGMAARRGMGCGDPWLPAQKPFDVVPHSTHTAINSKHFLFSNPHILCSHLNSKTLHIKGRRLLLTLYDHSRQRPVGPRD